MLTHLIKWLEIITQPRLISCRVRIGNRVVSAFDSPNYQATKTNQKKKEKT